MIGRLARVPHPLRGQHPTHVLSSFRSLPVPGRHAYKPQFAWLSSKALRSCFAIAQIAMLPQAANVADIHTTPNARAHPPWKKPASVVPFEDTP